MNQSKKGVAICSMVLTCMQLGLNAQTNSAGELKWFTYEEKGQFVKLTFCNQAWLRCAQNNQGSGVVGNIAFSVRLKLPKSVCEELVFS